jgi:hypothetical protein
MLPLLSLLYPRAALILAAFLGQFRALTPAWLLGLWLGATLSWFLRPMIRERGAEMARRSGGVAPLGLLLGALAGIASPISLLSLSGLLGQLGRERRLRPLVVGFGLASPLLDPTMFTFTALALGLPLAWARVATALAVALGAGGTLLFWEAHAQPRSPALPPAEGTPPSLPRTWTGYALALAREVYAYGRLYLLALLLTAWIEVLLPTPFLVGLLGRHPWGVPLSALLGGPLYLCGGGAIAVVRELLEHGLSHGAALAYLTVGPATTARALAGVVSVGGRRMVVVLVAGALLVAVVAGYLLDALMI